MATTLKGQIIRESQGTNLLLSLGARNGAQWHLWLDPEDLRKALDRAEEESVEVLLSLGDDGQVELYLTHMRVTGNIPVTKRNSGEDTE